MEGERDGNRGKRELERLRGTRENGRRMRWKSGAERGRAGLRDHDRSRLIIKRLTHRSIKGVYVPIDRRLIVDRSRSTISKREREREGERGRDRETERERKKRETEREREREGERERERDRERERRER